MTNKQIKARIIAIEEAAEHLAQDWTDNQEERKQGKIVAGYLWRWSRRLRDKQLATPPPAPAAVVSIQSPACKCGHAREEHLWDERCGSCYCTRYSAEPAAENGETK